MKGERQSSKPEMCFAGSDFFLGVCLLNMAGNLWVRREFEVVCIWPQRTMEQPGAIYSGSSGYFGNAGHDVWRTSKYDGIVMVKTPNAQSIK